MATVIKRVVVGADHGGFHLKNRITRYLESLCYQVKDVGVFSDESVDYPDTSRAACREYLTGGFAFGIVLCGTGIGASIAANKVNGIRCALVHDEYTARMAAAHNRANFLAFGGRLHYYVPVERMIDTFLETEFEAGRHARRIRKLERIEGDYPEDCGSHNSGREPPRY